MSLIIVAVVPLTSVIWNGLKVAGASSHRTDAFSIASRETESLHADPYGLLGFYGDQSASPWKGNTTVLVGGCSMTCTPPFAPLVLPTGSSTVAGVTYSIARFLYWADAQGLNNGATSTTFSQAYKASTVTVSWADQAGVHTVEQDSIVYPGGLGLYAGPGGAAPSTTSTTAPLLAPGTPTIALAATQPAPPQNQQEIDVTITAPVGGGAVAVYFVQWSTDSMFSAPSQSPQLPSTSTSYAAQGLAAATTYYLRTFASNVTGQSSYSAVVSLSTASVPSTTTTPASTTTVPAITTTTGVSTTTSSSSTSTTSTTLACNLGAFTITTSSTGKTYLDKSGNMTENVVLNLAVNGACLWAATVVSYLHGTATSDPGAPYALTGLPIGGQWSVTVGSSGQGNWSVGTHDLTVLLGGRTTSISHGLLICAWKPPGQRSALATVC